MGPSPRLCFPAFGFSLLSAWGCAGDAFRFPFMSAEDLYAEISCGGGGGGGMEVEGECGRDTSSGGSVVVILSGSVGGSKESHYEMGQSAKVY